MCLISWKDYFLFPFLETVALPFASLFHDEGMFNKFDINMHVMTHDMHCFIADNQGYFCKKKK